MANMREMLKLQSEAKKMQKQLQSKTLKGESKDALLTIYMNAAQEFQDIDIDQEVLEMEDLEQIKKRMKEAFKDYQKKLQKEMMQNMDLDSLKNMFN
ncbi:MAG: YbaB/EbfC family nucleoid-associated protein [Candidatus Dojkabacteria bacterium]|nr:YbaB/EbfC family nucleoid-associated protein [Candidatus Dojkabacteria bacterium]